MATILKVALVLLRMYQERGAPHPAIYQGNFMDPLLEQTENFYLRESNEKIGSLDVPSYLKHALSRLSEEGDRFGFASKRGFVGVMTRVEQERPCRKYRMMLTMMLSHEAL